MLKLAMAGRVSYYFCGRISLTSRNTVKNPLTVEVKTLNSQEVVGLYRAIKTGVIVAVEGLEELSAKVEELELAQKSKKEVEKEPVVIEQEVKQEATEKVEESEPTVEEPKEEKPTDEVEVKAPVKRVTTRKATTK